ncbi:hypothetical protein FNU76_02745 [Chitinimonas arctica]|uniref:Uncharacterized protein n=1 Tax=Chitinimonas arctica TaxID=2594795 RepID=A0A516SB34_9NEIS|nr:hypothetical protein [Chitinimonas arctica]QDQ25357.1 hypothetical protein FNU76_02745 [Chitinimonas arctica]
MKQQVKAVPASAVGLARDGVLQVGSAALTITGSAESFGAAVHLAATAAGIAGGALSVASGTAQIVQGGVTWRATNKARRVAKDLRDKMKACLNLKDRPSFRKLAAAREGCLFLTKDGKLDKRKIGVGNVNSRFGKYSENIQCFKATSRDEYRHMQAVYGAFYTQFISNQDFERSLQRDKRSHAKKRIIYGALGVAVGVTTIALAATGCGLVVLLAIGAVALLAGGLWIGYNTYRNRQLREQAKKAGRDNALQAGATNALKSKPLASLEEKMKSAGYAANSHLAAELLVKHLSGGKEAAKAKSAQARMDIATEKERFARKVAKENNAFEQGKGATIISETGVKIRREFATLFLLRTGMSEHDIHELKVLAANGQETLAAERIKRFLSNDGGRALWKPEASEGVTAPI